MRGLVWLAVAACGVAGASAQCSCGANVAFGLPGVCNAAKNGCACLSGVSGALCDQAAFLGEPGEAFCDALVEDPCPCGLLRDSEGECVLPPGIKEPEFTCPDGWTEGPNGSELCYTIAEHKYEAREAEELCYQIGGHLVAISDDATASFLDLNVIGLENLENKYWLGLKWPMIVSWNDENTVFENGLRFGDVEKPSQRPRWLSGQAYDVSSSKFSEEVQVVDDNGNFRCPVHQSKPFQWTTEPCDSTNIGVICQAPKVPIKCEEDYELSPQTGLCILRQVYPPTCATGWAEFMDSCYKVVKSRASYLQATSDCSSMDAQLASLNDVTQKTIVAFKQALPDLTSQSFVGVSNVLLGKFVNGQRFAYNPATHGTQLRGIVTPSSNHLQSVSNSDLHNYVCEQPKRTCPSGTTYFAESGVCERDARQISEGFVQALACGTSKLQSTDASEQGAGIQTIGKLLTCIENEFRQGSELLGSINSPVELQQVASIAYDALDDMVETNLPPFDTSLSIGELWSDSDAFNALASLHVAGGIQQFGVTPDSYFALPMTADVPAFLAANNPPFKLCMRAPAPCGRVYTTTDSLDAPTDAAVESPQEQLEVYMAYVRCAQIPRDQRLSKVSLVPLSAFISRATFCMSGLPVSNDDSATITPDVLLTALEEVMATLELMEDYGQVDFSRLQKLKGNTEKIRDSLAQPSLGGVVTVPKYSLELTLNEMKATSESYMSKATFMGLRESRSAILDAIDSKVGALGDQIADQLLVVQDNIIDGLNALSGQLSDQMDLINENFKQDAVAERARADADLQASEEKISFLAREMQDSMRKAEESSALMTQILDGEIVQTLDKMISLEAEFTRQEQIAAEKRASQSGFLTILKSVGQMVLSAAGPIGKLASVALDFIPVRSAAHKNTTGPQGDAASRDRDLREQRRAARLAKTSARYGRDLATSSDCAKKFNFPDYTRSDSKKPFQGSVSEFDLSKPREISKYRSKPVKSGLKAGNEETCQNFGPSCMAGSWLEMASDLNEAGESLLAIVEVAQEVGPLFVGDFRQEQCRSSIRLFHCRSEDAIPILASCCEYSSYLGQDKFFSCSELEGSDLCLEVLDDSETLETGDIKEWSPAIAENEQMEAVCYDSADLPGISSSYYLVEGMMQVSCCVTETDPINPTLCDRNFWRQELLIPVTRRENDINNNTDTETIEEVEEEKKHDGNTSKPRDLRELVLTTSAATSSNCCKCRPSAAAPSRSVTPTPTNSWEVNPPRPKSSGRPLLSKAKSFSSKAKKGLSKAAGAANLVNNILQTVGLIGSSPEYSEPIQFPDVPTAEQVGKSQEQIGKVLQSAATALANLGKRYVFLQYNLEYDAQPDEGAGEHPALWDSLYHQIMDMLEYDLNLCPQLVPDDGNSALGRRLRHRSGSGSELETVSMRRSMESKKETERKIAEAEAAMQRAKDEYFAERKKLRIQCGHFRGAVRQLTIWAKNAHTVFYRMFEESRNRQALVTQIGIAEARIDQIAAFMAESASSGESARSQINNINPLPGRSTVLRDSVTRELARSVLETSFQEDIFDLRYIAETKLQQLCAAALYVDPTLLDKLEGNQCKLGLDLLKDPSFVSLSLFELGERIDAFRTLVANSLIDSRLKYGQSEVSLRTLDVTETLDLPGLKSTGNAAFTLTGPYGGVTRNPDGTSAAKERGGPFFCASDEVLDNVVMKSVGILFFDEDGKILGPSRSSTQEGLRVDFKLSGPFLKTRKGEQYLYDLPDYTTSFFTYILPNANGDCQNDETRFSVGDTTICKGSAQGELNPNEAPLPSPYGSWEITVAPGSMKYLPNVAEVRIIVGLIGVSILGEPYEYSCRIPTTRYRSDSVLGDDNGEVTTGGAASAGLLIPLVVGAVLLLGGGSAVAYRMHHGGASDAADAKSVANPKAEISNTPEEASRKRSNVPSPLLSQWSRVSVGTRSTILELLSRKKSNTLERDNSTPEF